MSDGEQVFNGPGEGVPIPEVGGAVKITGAQTGGRYAVQEMIMPPGIMVPRHVHSRETEAWYVVSGTLTFHLVERTFEAPAGSFVHIPIGVEHSFGNTSNGPSKFIEIVSPPGLENYFVDRAAIARRGDPDTDYAGLTPADHKQLADKYGLTFLGE